jgi:uncharacterized membrane-anchored protein YhcB (DUF1043 family)
MNFKEALGHITVSIKELQEYERTLDYSVNARKNVEANFELDLAALAVLAEMAEDYEKVKAEVEEHENARSLLTELCQREKTRAEKAEVELESERAAHNLTLQQVANLDRQIDKLGAEVERFNKECLSHFRGKDGLGTCGSGCQWYPGDGNVCPMSRGGLMADLEKAEAKLAKWGPVIKAAMAPIPPDEKRYAGTRIGKAVWEQFIVRAALKCREGKP